MNEDDIEANDAIALQYIEAINKIEEAGLVSFSDSLIEFDMTGASDLDIPADVLDVLSNAVTAGNEEFAAGNVDYRLVQLETDGGNEANG